MQWHVQSGGRVEGPVEEEALKDRIRAGELGRETMLWNERMGDRWAPLGEFPLLAALVPGAGEGDAERDEELGRCLDAIEQQRLRRRRVIGLTAAAAVLVSAAVTAVVVYAKATAPYRALGVSAANPIGSFQRLDRLLTRDLLMDRYAAPNCPGIARTAPTVYVYSNPKGSRGKRVGAEGTITVLAEGERVTGICVVFVGSVSKGVTLYDPSVSGLWAKRLWRLFDPADETVFRAPVSWPAGTWERTGLEGPRPGEGALAIFEAEHSRGCWYEVTRNAPRSIVFIEPK